MSVKFKVGDKIILTNYTGIKDNEYKNGTIYKIKRIIERGHDSSDEYWVDSSYYFFKREFKAYNSKSAYPKWF